MNRDEEWELLRKLVRDKLVTYETPNNAWENGYRRAVEFVDAKMSQMERRRVETKP